MPTRPFIWAATAISSPNMPTVNMLGLSLQDQYQVTDMMIPIRLSMSAAAHLPQRARPRLDARIAPAVRPTGAEKRRIPSTTVENTAIRPAIALGNLRLHSSRPPWTLLAATASQ